MDPKDELNELLFKEAPALQVAKAVTIGLGVAIKLYASFGGNLDNLKRIIQLVGTINAIEMIESQDNIPGVPDRFAVPLMRKATPGFVESLVNNMWNKYIPKV